jgi:hypothetical protein
MQSWRMLYRHKNRVLISLDTRRSPHAARSACELHGAQPVILYSGTLSGGALLQRKLCARGKKPFMALSARQSEQTKSRPFASSAVYSHMTPSELSYAQTAQREPGCDARQDGVMLERRVQQH